MAKLRRIATFAAAIAVLWLAALLVVDAALEGRTGRRTAEQIAESLQADATIDRGDLAPSAAGSTSRTSPSAATTWSAI